MADGPNRREPLQHIDRLTERPDVADVRTSVVYQHLVSRPVPPLLPGRGPGGSTVFSNVSSGLGT
jgi:hypothetical protein